MRKDCDNTANVTAYADKLSAPVTPLFRTKAERIPAIDFLRGLCVILMVLDHISFDFMALPEWSTNFYIVNNKFLDYMSDWVYYDWWDGGTRVVLRLTVIFIFFTLSGICSTFSKNNLLRGIRIAIAAAILSLVTVTADKMFDMGISILFGVIHCFAVSIIIYALMELTMKQYTKYACLVFGLLFIALGLKINFYYIGVNNVITGEIGFTEFMKIVLGTGYYGADCFGILPYTGMFLLGAFGGKQLYTLKKAYLPIFGKAPFKPVCFIGRKAVWFYLLHQPVILVLFIILGSALGLKFF